MKNKNWYKLENAAVFFSFTNKEKTPDVFRYSVTLKKDINSSVLQTALNDSLDYFPNFQSHLKRGFFWYYLENEDSEPLVEQEKTAICSKILKNDEDNLIRINYYSNRINFEISHILSDGRGSLMFFKCLIYKYLMLLEKIDNVEIDSDSSQFEKSEDSFDKNYTRQKNRHTKNVQVYQFKSKKRKDILFMEYHISVNKTLGLAHQYNASLTSLLLSVLICSYHEQMKQLEYNKTIKIDVPVDLRRFFNSATTRNFFGITSVSYKFDSKNYKFEDVIKSVNNQMTLNTTLEQLTVRMNQMVALEKNIFARFVPVYVKEIVLRLADSIVSTGSTCCLSNIGAIKVDDRLKDYIENFNILNTTDGLKFTVCSYQDDLSIGISSKFIDLNIVKRFCRFFSEHNIDGTMNISEDN